MRPGDIVLSVARQDDPVGTKLPRVLIRAGQWLKASFFGKADPEVPIVHAAIAIGDDRVIESVGEGIVETNLNDDPQRSALIYSCFGDRLAEAAVIAAQQFYDNGAVASIPARYSKWAAMLSIFRNSSYGADLSERINESVDIGSASFCSQFVANCYEVGNLYMSANLLPPPPPVFQLRPSAMTPYDLALQCESDGRFALTGFWDEGTQVNFAS
ncbi:MULTISPECIES: hypothetical protein [Burkholderia]|uniref:hypothetical protein n=1 Tax=Burkholderia TaxID=32008 RepID=UPI000841902D|nr:MULTISPECIES: hypothetical protein [unclassified Burkholderia]AOK28081.1 hypothetical protein AQ611_00200 [Burkholderia sp. Bp7605]